RHRLDTAGSVDPSVVRQRIDKPYRPNVNAAQSGSCGGESWAPRGAARRVRRAARRSSPPSSARLLARAGHPRLSPPPLEVPVLAIVCPGQGAQKPGFLTPWRQLPGPDEAPAAPPAPAGIGLLRHGPA